MTDYFECCHNCKPPERFPGCGKNCKKYKIAKIKKELEKRWLHREELKMTANVSPTLRKNEWREYRKRRK